jgi:hypothetical protein
MFRSLSSDGFILTREILPDSKFAQTQNGQNVLGEASRWVAAGPSIGRGADE